MKNLESVGQDKRSLKRTEGTSSRIYTRRILITFVLIVIFIISGGSISYYLQQHQQQDGIENDLNAIAQLKIAQLTAWQQERLADADFMLEVLNNNHPYENVLLVRPDGTKQPVAAIIMAVLVRKDCQDVLFLNDVKFNPNGEQVLSIVRPVPNTPWFIVAKIDIREAFSPIRFDSALILGLTGVTLIIILIVAAYYIQRRRRLTFELLYQNEREREAIQKHFEYLVKFANDMIFLIGEDLHIIVANDRALEVYGYTREELPELTIDDLVAPHSLVAHRQKIKDLSAGGHNLYQSVHQLKNGTTFPVEVSAVNITVEGQSYLQWIIRDITERKIAEQMLISAKDEMEVKVAERTSELARANAQLQSFAARMVRVQEEEKKRIARDLHDQIGQSLTALKLMISQATRLTSKQATPTLTEAQKVLSELMGQVREMSLNLRPSMLDDLGLLPALTWHFEKYQNQTKIKVIFNHKGLQRHFSPVIAETGYRVVQEALTNAAKYAGVTEVQIDAWADENTLTLRVEDSGRGFTPAKIASNVSFGLRGMSERLSAVGGNLQVVSEPGSGTILTAVIPLGEDEDGHPKH